MATTFYQVGLRITETVKLVEDQRLSLVSTGSTGFLTSENVILADGIPFDAFDAPAYNTGEVQIRTAFSNALLTAGGAIGPCITESAKSLGLLGVGVPQTAPSAIFPLLYQFMAQNQNSTAFQSQPLVYSRGLTRGTPSYGSSNVGTGILYRLNVDPYAFPLEGGFAEKLNFQCTKDVQLGTLPGQEQFSVQGQPFRDALSWYSTGFGSGLSASGAQGLTGITADTTQTLIQNSSFSQYSGTGGAASFALNGWTQSSGLAASMSVDTTNYYRASQQEGSAPGSLKCTGSVTITQLLSSNSGALAFTAYLNQIAWYGTLGTWVGSFTVQVGSKSWSVSSGAAGWQTLRPTIDKNLWFQNFNVASLAVTLTITVTSGYLLLDDFCWAPMTNIGGALYWLIGGVTNFLALDTITLIDSEPSPPKKVQNWLRLSFPGVYLPSAALPTAPATAPVLAVSGTAGAVTAGAHVGWFTYLTAAGESSVSPPSNIIVVDGTKKLDWTSIAVGPGGTLTRSLYLSTVNQTGTYATPYFLYSVPDNATTTATQGVADASLTKMAGTIAEPL